MAINLYYVTITKIDFRGKTAKTVDKSGGSGIIKAKNVETAVSGVNFIGKIDREIYKCVTEDIITDDVVITDERIKHTEENHPDVYKSYGQYLQEIVKAPNYIFAGNRPKTALILKHVPEVDEKFKTVMRLITPEDDESFKNSIITFMKTDEKEWSRLVRNKKILYKSE